MCTYFSSPDKRDLRRRRFIQKNNRKIEASLPALCGKELLVLVPHCLQWSECPYKITHHAENCRQCGKCIIPALLSLQEKYGFSLRVATGGNFAREIIKTLRPKGVIALACERDLESGIREIRSIPVYGVLISRSNTPCFDTHVSIDSIEKALHIMLGE
jgi:hypothetical protein